MSEHEPRLPSLGFKLPNGKRLRDASRTEILEGACVYERRAADCKRRTDAARLAGPLLVSEDTSAK
jgi:hypothetical protein